MTLGQQSTAESPQNNATMPTAVQPHCQGEQSQTTNPWGETILEQETDTDPLPAQSLNLGSAQSILQSFCRVAQMAKLRSGCSDVTLLWILRESCVGVVQI